MIKFKSEHEYAREIYEKAEALSKEITPVLEGQDMDVCLIAMCSLMTFSMMVKVDAGNGTDASQLSAMGALMEEYLSVWREAQRRHKQASGGVQ